MGNIVPFMFEDKAIRVTDHQGNPWFIAKDVCDCLGLDTSNLSKLLDDDERATCSVQCTDQVRDMTMVNEPGLYSLVLRSRKPEAKNFKRWITHEVLPAIRKTGRYAAPAFDLDALTASAAKGNQLAKTLGLFGGQLTIAVNEFVRLSMGVDLLQIANVTPGSEMPTPQYLSDGSMVDRVRNYAFIHGRFVSRQMQRDLNLNEREKWNARKAIHRLTHMGELNRIKNGHYELAYGSVAQ